MDMSAITPELAEQMAAASGWFPQPHILFMLFLGVIALCLASVGGDDGDNG